MQINIVHNIRSIYQNLTELYSVKYHKYIHIVYLLLNTKIRQGRKKRIMKKHINLAVILAIFIVPIVMYYSFKSTGQDTATVAKSMSPMVLDFSSEMCFECQQLKKQMDQVEPKYNKVIMFKKIMINSAKPEDQQLIKKYKIKVVPTLVYIDKNGNVVNKTEGALTKQELERNFNRLLNGKSN